MGDAETYEDHAGAELIEALNTGNQRRMWHQCILRQVLTFATTVYLAANSVEFVSATYSPADLSCL